MKLNIDLPGGGYPVVLKSDAFAGLGASIMDALPETTNCVVISSKTLWPLFGEAVLQSLRGVGISGHVLVVPDGESEKSFDRWVWLVNEIIALGVDRQTPVLAVGGGVIGDLAGFVAAPVKRGLPFVQVPTSLLAMVDSSVGGKTAINTHHGKNLVGAFHQPALVYVSIDALEHLPQLQLESGLGEVVKHGMLADPQLLLTCRTNRELIRQRDVEILKELILRSIQVKSDFVVEDERERGVRALLNLGHTVGHALEKVLMDTPNALPHGICVAIGVLAETHWAHRLGSCSSETVDEFEVTLVALGLPTCPPKLDAQAVLRASGFDKKARRGKLATPIVQGVGRVILTEIDLDEIADMFYSLPGFHDA